MPAAAARGEGPAEPRSSGLRRRVRMRACSAAPRAPGPATARPVAPTRAGAVGAAWARPRGGVLVTEAARRAALAGGAAAALAAAQWLGRTSGSTRAERRRRLPGDQLVPEPTVVTNHAVTIPAPPERVWPWLVQMGWHPGGWDTPRWVDRLLFPGNWPSAARLVPDLQRPLAVGERIPDRPPGPPWFVVEGADQPRLL